MELTQVEGINIVAFVGLVEDNESVLSFTHFDLEDFLQNANERVKLTRSFYDRWKSPLRATSLANPFIRARVTARRRRRRRDSGDSGDSAVSKNTVAPAG